jgi:hypothetical protein
LVLRLAGGGFISQEVRPEDKMVTDSQNGNIIILSQTTAKWQCEWCRQQEESRLSGRARSSYRVEGEFYKKS